MGMFSFKSKSNYDTSKVYAPINGHVRSLASLKDGVFSEHMMGDGVVVALPSGAKEIDVLSPVEGELVTVFPTGHAYGIKTKSGLEVLVHIGVDTVNLNGEGFEKYVVQGKKVKVGEKLVKINAPQIAKKVPTADIILIVTSGHKIANLAKGDVMAQAELFTVSE